MAGFLGGPSEHGSRDTSTLMVTSSPTPITSVRVQYMFVVIIVIIVVEAVVVSPNVHFCATPILIQISTLLLFRSTGFVGRRLIPGLWFRIILSSKATLPGLRDWFSAGLQGPSGPKK